MGIIVALIFFGIAIALALIGLGLVIGFGGASIPFIAISMYQTEEIRVEKAKTYLDREITDGRQDWHLKLREMHLGAQSSEPEEILDPDHSPEILD